MRRSLLLLWLLLLIPLVIVSCRKRVAAPMPEDGCLDWIEEQFGPQRTFVVALHPMAGNAIFKPELLDAVDYVTARLEDAQTDYALAIRSITTAPLLVPSPGGVKMERIRDGLPVDQVGAHRYQGLLMSYEFAIGDAVDAGASRTFVHLPRDNFVGVDLDTLVEEIRVDVADKLMIALDGTAAADRSMYKEVAGMGPSSDAVWVVFDSEEKGAMKTPQFLRALQLFQTRVESLPTTAGTYSVAEDVKLVRRATHKGDPAAYALPNKQVEITQLLMMYQLSGNAADFGERITDDGRLTVVRVHLPVLKDGARTRTARQIRQYAREGFPVGVNAGVCVEQH